MYSKKKILCITPDLRKTGAPIALLGLIKILLSNDKYDIYVMTYGTGELLTSYTQMLDEKKIIILDFLNPTPEFRTSIQSGYDLIILNTAAVYPFSFFFQNTEIPVYWWIHEAPSLIEDSFPAFPNPHLLSSNFQLCVSSAGSAELFRSHYSYDASVLPAPVFAPESITTDIPLELPDDRVLFLIPAAYTGLKGQDILLSSISRLPDEFGKRALFVFCGYTLDKQIRYKEELFRIASGFDNVLMMDEFPIETIYALMNRCDCVIAPSRVDTIPLTIVEGMMFKKLCLVSSHTGISHYIKDCVNGFVFNDTDELLQRLLLIISDHNKMDHIAQNGFKIYEDYFSPRSVSEVINKYLGTV